MAGACSTCVSAQVTPEPPTRGLPAKGGSAWSSTFPSLLFQALSHRALRRLSSFQIPPVSHTTQRFSFSCTCAAATRCPYGDDNAALRGFLSILNPTVTLKFRFPSEIKLRFEPRLLSLMFLMDSGSELSKYPDLQTAAGGRNLQAFIVFCLVASSHTRQPTRGNTGVVLSSIICHKNASPTSGIIHQWRRKPARRSALSICSSSVSSDVILLLLWRMDFLSLRRFLDV